MDDLIRRQDAIDALWKALYDYEDKTEKQFLESEELNTDDWFQHRIFVQNMNDVDRQTIIALPSAQQWIPVSEKLPEKDGRYWVWCEIFIVPDHVDDPCSYYGSREASYLDGHWYGDSIGKVVAWMPLPEAWKGSEDEG